MRFILQSISDLRKIIPTEIRVAILNKKEKARIFQHRRIRTFHIIEISKSQHLPVSIVPLIKQIEHQRLISSTYQSISILLQKLV